MAAYTTTATEDAHGHDDHGPEFEFVDDPHGNVNPESMNPAPSYWPFLISLVIILIPVSTLTFFYGGPERRLLALGMLAAGLGLVVVPIMGWCHSVIVDKWRGHFGPIAQGRDLVLGTKLFFLSEIAIFGALFAYYGGMRLHFSRLGTEWPLEGSPHIHVALPAVGLLLLLTSSVTCEFGHKAIMAGHRGLCKTWLLITIALGVVFLALQGYEWGYLIGHEQFTVATNPFGTLFYMLTGFHGFHVMTGLIMLILVYGRLEIGHYTPGRHFSLMAASWYWHLVDVVWIFVFVFIYALQ